MKTTTHTPRILGLLITSLFVSNQSQANPPAANALPTGGTVTSGIGSISSMGSALSVTQSSQNLFTQFDTFNVGAAASVQFLQPNSSAIAVSRIVGGEVSQIFGRLSANGQLFLLNPRGVVFGQSAQVDVGGLVASSLKLSDKDLLSGQYALSQGTGAGAVRNFGEIIAREGGLVALVAPTVENAGTIRADGGQIAMVAGDAVRLELGQGGLIGVTVDGGVAQAQIDNSGSLLADGGKVWMTARQAGDLVGSAVNQAGVVRANTVAQRNGEIWIDGGPQGTVTLGGQTLAMGTGAGEAGGRIAATAGDVRVTGKVDASASAGKGYIEIGGGFQGRNERLANARRTTLENTAEVKANATVDGDGGTAIVWSEERSNVAGVMQAQGVGEGKGGLIETSSRGVLGSTAAVDVSAVSGQHGQWLLDPTTITIAAGGPTPTNGVDAVNTVDAATISNALTSGANVTVMGTDSINIDADISKTGGARSSLTFTAPNAINLGRVAQSRQISATDAPNSGVTSSLDVAFNGGTTGKVTLFGSISTNGGNVTFDKAVDLASARPISTSVSQPNAGMPASNASGNIVFNEAVRLIGANPVTLDTQSVRDGGGNSISDGGDITFNKTVDSLGTGNLPLALILNTTGSIVNADPMITTPTNRSGEVVFKDNVGATDPLRSITINGPSTVSLGDPSAGTAAQTVNLKNDGGPVLTFSAPGDIRPALLLNSASTTINVTGFGASGTSNYLQSTFDIIKGTSTAVNTSAASLSINSDRSIQLIDTDILGSKTGTSEPTNATLDVTLNSNRLGTADINTNSGGVSLEGQRGVNIVTSGGNIVLTGGSDGMGRAYGVAGEQNTDGILLQNTTLDTSTGSPMNQNTGDITLRGASPVDDGSGGTAVRLFGTTNLNAGNQDIVVDGLVETTSGGAPKDAVLIGSGGTAGVNIITAGAGTVTIMGDASAVSPGAQAGASYNGVELSRGANIRTENGDILVRGFGGGGNNVNVGENVGVRLKDSDTQVTSKTGDITLVGQTGGKTSSYAIATSGDDISIGQRRDQTVARNATADTFTGNVNLVGDTMQFVNNATNRLRVTTQRDAMNVNPLSTGQINIRSLHDVAIQIGGMEPTPPSSDNVAMPDKPLFLASELFSGSNAVLIPGAGEINIGQFGHNTLNGLAVGESSKTISVNGATTVRDPLNLLARGGDAMTGGNVAFNSNLTVQGTPGAAPRTANIEVAAGVTQGTNASLNAANLRVDAGNDVLLLGANQIGIVAIQTHGNVTVGNAQALTVGTVSRDLLGANTSTSGITTQENSTVAGRVLNVTVNGSNADLTIAQALSNTGGLVAVQALGETLSASQRGNAINQSGAGTITAADLIVRAQDNSDLTLSGNQFGRLAVDMSTGGGDLSVVRGSTTAGDITIDSLSIPTLSTGAALPITVSGVTASDTTGQVFIQNLNGGLTQTNSAPVIVGGLAVNTTGAITLNALSAATGTPAINQIDSLAAITSNGSITVTNLTAMAVDSVATQTNAAIPAELKRETGVRAQGAAQTVSLNVTGAAAGLTINNVDNDPDANINNAVTATGNVSLSTGTGPLTVQGAVLASDAAVNNEIASIALGTTGGNVSISNKLEATTDVSVVTNTVATLGASITTNAATGAPANLPAGIIIANNGKVVLQTNVGSISQNASVEARGGSVEFTTQSGNITQNATVVAIGGVADDSGFVTLKTGTGSIASNADVTAQKGSIEAVAGVSGDITIKSNLSADNVADNADIVLSSSLGKVSLGDSANAMAAIGNVTASGTGDVRLRGTSIEQFTGAITASGLSANAIGTTASTATVLSPDNVSLRGNNSFTTLTAKSAAGSVDVKNTKTGDTFIGQVLGSSTNADTQDGLSAAGQITLQTAGGLVQNVSLGNVPNLVLAEGGLYIDAAAGNVTLTNAGNKLDEVAVKANTVANQNVALNSSSAVKLDTRARRNLGATSDTTHAGVNATGKVSVNTGDTINVTATLTQTAGAALVADAIVLNSTGATTLVDTGNSVNTVAASAGDNLNLLNNKALQIVTDTNAANANASVTGLSSTGSINNTVAVKLTGTSSNLTQAAGATVVTGNAALVATGNVTLNDAGNNVGQFAATAANVTLTDTGGLVFASVATEFPNPAPATTKQTVNGIQTGQFVVNSNGAVTQQATASVSATDLELRTTNPAFGAGDAVLINRQNQIGNLSGTIAGSTDIYSAADVSILPVNGLNGLSATGDLQVRSAKNLTLQPGAVVSANNQSLVLAADAAFTNLAGPNALQPGTGRWLIYDSNLTLQDRLGGLQPDFRRFVTTFDSYSPAQVLEAGNGYLNDALVVNPNDSVRAGAGVGSSSTAGGGAAVSTSTLQVLANTGAVGDVYASVQGTPLPEFPVSQPAFFVDGKMGASFDVPVLVQVNNRVPFSIALNSLVGAKQVKGVSMVDGSALPNWIDFDAERSIIFGRVPSKQNEPFILVVATELPDGQLSSLNVFFNPTPQEELE